MGFECQEEIDHNPKTTKYWTLLAKLVIFQYLQQEEQRTVFQKEGIPDPGSEETMTVLASNLRPSRCRVLHVVTLHRLTNDPHLV